MLHNQIIRNINRKERQKYLHEVVVVATDDIAQMVHVEHAQFLRHRV